jgi:hypothetical protein
MNIIDAWKSAKVGQLIRCTIRPTSWKIPDPDPVQWSIKKNNLMDLTRDICNRKEAGVTDIFFDKFILSDRWEIVHTMRKMMSSGFVTHPGVTPLTVVVEFSTEGCVPPSGTRVTAMWDVEE